MTTASRTTQLGMRHTRLPPGPARDQLFHLSKTASKICHLWRYHTLAKIADGLASALIDLSAAEFRATTAERALAAASIRIGELRQQNDRLRAESFDVPTKTHDTTEFVPLTARTAQIDIPRGGGS